MGYMYIKLTQGEGFHVTREYQGNIWETYLQNFLHIHQQIFVFIACIW